MIVSEPHDQLSVGDGRGLDGAWIQDCTEWGAVEVDIVLMRFTDMGDVTIIIWTINQHSGILFGAPTIPDSLTGSCVCTRYMDTEDGVLCRAWNRGSQSEDQPLSLSKQQLAVG